MCSKYLQNILNVNFCNISEKSEENFITNLDKNRKNIENFFLENFDDIP